MDPRERDIAYIWDIFDHESTPIDGVLISREQVEDTPAKFNRITENGVYDAPMLDLPEWLPTISDCGAWGYKALPFPPYGNKGMLEFYETLNVSVGVTIDHLVLGSGHTARLYLDERAFPDGFTASDIPDAVTDEIDVMTDEWPTEWPAYVQEYEPSICSTGVTEFDTTVFDQPLPAVLTDLEDHPHAVYREDDMSFRYDLTLANAEEMKELYEAGKYSFRLMVAVQGWDPQSYEQATEEVLDMGYQYLGIGGVAGSSEEAVKDCVESVGQAVKAYEREHNTRVDTHVFGFAKTGAFDAIGQAGMSSFDSASMLRAAWTGGENYHLDDTQRYDAIRIRYPSSGDDLGDAVETALRGQEMLYALRAFDNNKSIVDALTEWHEAAIPALDQLEPYLKEHRHDDRYDQSLLREIKEELRTDYAYGRKLRSNFSGKFRGRLAKLLRKDDPDSPLPFSQYQELIDQVRTVFTDRTPTKIEKIKDKETTSGEYGTYKQLVPLLEDYVEHVKDEDLLDGYRDLLRRQPWRECGCPICEEHGIEVATFRGNNRNRRRGFHNTHRFYEQFERALPKIAVLTRGGVRLSRKDSVETFLQDDRNRLWSQVHDLPVVEIGAVTANGVHEWWETPPASISFAPHAMQAVLTDYCTRYQTVYIDGSNWTPDQELIDAVEATGCAVHLLTDPTELRTAVLDQLGYDTEFASEPMTQSGITDY
ncbi:queuine tRNA-ribosyltransferase tRNA-guanine transglycosylase [Natronococcus sp. A-GB1]|uniref:queuine tRNA-ribosyltransferase tRNA-guanine transglycosylase n=1 Tax=Natronococcus sp. A-GB1 TaxID=3037648 RepID=UPI00241E2C6F|nr:queuine tRNA-ribosyltransferase tRNA-guanine transglycosylase [Natronococcus sp. A-GB1]MDG5761336.1 queuine tRNA-ribosyltransferase tRNA-guanine transglycosylase [Natronococcus sp. A-GB1]